MDIATAGAPGDRVLLMGNEAIARGALEAGLRLAAAYPGTPSSEVVEALAAAAAAHGGLHVEWSTNEKVAFDVAAGAAITGARALVAMKNAGLNWAMDTFMTLPYSGVRGGMLVVVADDPDTHYSSAEQDTRTAAIYAEIPCFEPHDQQAAHDMALAAFSLSEHLELPIMLRSVTRVSHASGDVTLGELPAGPIGPAIGFNRHWRAPYRWNVYGPPGATHKHAWLHSRQPLMQEYAETCPFNVFTSPRGAETAVITSGVAAAYLREAAEDLGLGDQLAVAHLGLIWPLPRHTLAGFLKGIKTVLVVEEGDPVMEEKLAVLVRDLGLDLTIRGKMHAPLFKPYGELTPDLVREALLTATAG
ncbi:MAG TPA: indolepyruvate ferredoxin oxidoreductase subunit alpha, partial [Firmicutes bacterium]|nr:indolepyruvate ferredoxin oxidoreductase subunit alpha [Bacillota bacterium]